jgi:hypothetical protein
MNNVIVYFILNRIKCAFFWYVSDHWVKSLVFFNKLITPAHDYQQLVREVPFLLRALSPYFWHLVNVGLKLPLYMGLFSLLSSLNGTIPPNIIAWLYPSLGKSKTELAIPQQVLVDLHFPIWACL